MHMITNEGPNFALKLHAVADNTAKNSTGLRFCYTMKMRGADLQMWAM